MELAVEHGIQETRKRHALKVRHLDAGTEEALELRTPLFHADLLEDGSHALLGGEVRHRCCGSFGAQLLAQAAEL